MPLLQKCANQFKENHLFACKIHLSAIQIHLSALQIHIFGIQLQMQKCKFEF